MSADESVTHPGSHPGVRPVAVVTGASRGIGAAVARVLAPDHHLVLVARDAAALGRVAAGLPDAETVAVDLTDPAAAARVAASATAAARPVSVLVHCAGIAPLGTVAEADTGAWRRSFEVNVVAVAALTRELLPALRAAGGHVVAVNSGAGLAARPGWGPYAAAKFALRALTDALRQEEPGLRVTSVHPGRVDTDMQREIVRLEAGAGAGGGPDGGGYDPARYLRPESVARAVRQAVDAADDAHPTEIVLRPLNRS